MSTFRKPRIPANVWIDRFRLSHGEKYIYPENQEFKSSKKIEIICPLHGSFYQSCKEHIKYGCPECGNKKRKDKRKFSSSEILKKLQESRVNNPYIYTFKSSTPSVKEHVIITCPLHGDFLQIIESHILGQGCPKCYSDSKKYNGSTHIAANEWINRFNEIHCFQYLYTFPDVFNQYSIISATCKVCDSVFDIVPYAHIKGKYRCKQCFPGNRSSYEILICNFLDSLGVEYVKTYRPDWLNGKELDIYVPEFNFAIEFNGSYWHSDKFLDNWYHFDKWKACKQNGIKLLNVWEHYFNKPEKKKIYFHKILHLLQLDNRVYARKCEIKEITRDTYDDFIFENHIEGSVFPYRGMKYIGLFYNDKVLMVAGYGEFYNQSSKSFKWKLQRICTISGITVIGGVSRLSRYIKNDIGDFIFQVTLDTGGSLIKNEISHSDVSLRYWWVKNDSVLSRNQTQISILKRNDDWDNNDTEKSYMEKKGFVKIFDSGVVSI